MQSATRPPRVVGKLGATLMSVNGMIGAGIFALPALLYEEVGNFAPWMFLIFGILFSAGILISSVLGVFPNGTAPTTFQTPSSYTDTSMLPFIVLAPTDTVLITNRRDTGITKSFFVISILLKGKRHLRESA